MDEIKKKYSFSSLVSKRHEHRLGLGLSRTYIESHLVTDDLESVWVTVLP